MASTPTISAKIELIGAQEIAKQLEDLGKVGAKAYSDIQRQAEKAGGFDKLDPTEVTKKLEKLGLKGPEAFNKIQKAVEDTARLERFTGALEKVENAVGGLMKSAAGLARAF